MTPVIAYSCGNCIHNIRSALDNLACRLALTADSACKCKETKFPFTENERDWTANSQSRLPGVPKEAREIRRQLQPWAVPISPNRLLMLNRLSNMDKHRYCAFSLACSQDTAFRVQCIDGTIVDVWPRAALYLREVQTFTVPVSSSLVGESARVQAKGTFVVTFRDEGPWGDLHVTAASPATGSLAPPMVSLGRMVSVIKIEAAQLIR